MDRRVVIESFTTAANAYGEPIKTWSVFATVWAQVSPMRGEERFSAQQIDARATTRFRIRYRSDLDQTMRLSYGGDAYDITAILEIGRQEGLDLMAVAQVP